ncbi:hypothetical protein EV652_10789 [Kribbella steppae]|uniref:Uncharacterized protein n=1 Tax=Kribbella steppae TaxID=2512223 RepID=A0A4V2RZG0_9ACTN|nr:hypothetical protein [Kribbella steppae]TCO26198.1 hypothetical protein EV652_10789 [Kribbella steppae]
MLAHGTDLLAAEQAVGTAQDGDDLLRIQRAAVAAMAAVATEKITSLSRKEPLI